MTDLASYLPALRARIDSATNEAITQTCTLGVDHAEAKDFVVAAQRAVSSGKRFRAIGAHLGAAVATNTEPGSHPMVDHLASALELYQASALAHDDVIDHAQTRRGTPTPHIQFSRLHSENGWLGSSPEFGQASAILLGDLLFSAAEDAIRRCAFTLPSTCGEKLFAGFTRMHTEVAVGQYLDIRAEQTPLDPHDDSSINGEIVEQVVYLKSARYSVIHPVLLGATLEGASCELLDTLEKILRPWGMAFQYRDDVLGVFGDPEVTGKPAGDDLIEGKRTMLLAFTWAQATTEERALITSMMNAPTDKRHEYVDAVREIISTRGYDSHETLISGLVVEGNTHLAQVATQGLLSPASVKLLEDLGKMLTARTS